MGINDLFNVNPHVRLVAKLSSDEVGPEELVAFGARSTIRRDDAYTLYQKAFREDTVEDVKKRLLNITIGSGHIDVLDQAVFTFIFRDIPRLSTLFLVSPIYLSHLQQSMRYVQPYGVYIPEELLKEKDVRASAQESIKLYYVMVNDEVPKEDARFVIPLYTVTNIQTVGNARELTHTYLMSMDDGVPPITKRLIKEMLDEASEEAPELFKDRGPNFNRTRYYPAPNLFSLENKYMKKVVEEYRRNNVTLLSYSQPFKIYEEDIIRALKNNDEKYFSLLKYDKYLFLVKMSITTFHQAIRQRTWRHTVESIYDSLERMDYIIPPEIIRRGWGERYEVVVKTLYKLYHSLIERGYEKEIAVGVIPHAHRIYDMIEMDGWNYIGALPLRRCLRAQWEIRMLSTEISRYVSRINPELGKYSLPACRVFGYCPEKNPCEYVDILLRKKPLITRT